MDRLGMNLPEREQPLVLSWASRGRPAGLIQFDRPVQWVAFVDGLGIDPRIPSVVGAKFGRAQKLYLLGWIDADLIKAGELLALTALELALKDRYGDHRPKNDRSFAALLKHMVEADGLGDEQIPMVVRSGGSAIGQITGKTRPSLSELRNSMAHGDPFDGAPIGGLLELVRDLIEFAYRHYLAEARAESPEK